MSDAVHLSALNGRRQPDRFTCGPSCLVAARMLIDPAFALSVRRRGWDAEVLATHRRVVGCVGADGRLQLPWPRALGTPPWALANELSSSGVRYRARLTRLDPRRELPAVHEAVAAGHPAPLFIGDRWLPRHVVLAVAEAAGRLLVYEPASGELVDVADDRVSASRLSLAGWSRLWFSVLPPRNRPA